MSLTWKSSFVSNEYRIFRGKLVAGILKTNTWKGDAYGELNGHLLKFKPASFWGSETQILDIEGQTELGYIKYNLWKQEAEITLAGQAYTFNYTSWTHQKWVIKGEQDEAAFKCKGFWDVEGTITYDGMTDSILLTALYIHYHFMRMNSAGIY